MLQMNHDVLQDLFTRCEKNTTGATIHGVRGALCLLKDCVELYVDHTNKGDYTLVEATYGADYKALGMRQLRKLGEPESLWNGCGCNK